MTPTLIRPVAASAGNCEAAHIVWRAALDGLSCLVACARSVRLRVAGNARLDRRMLNDIGLLPEQSPDAPIWGRGGVMWRP
ncbi:MAG: hypothetical protein IT555_21050 [Acetobacteraceae bacterium]|nr:hypothetical protein [Acetobacteraceae bacterium]